MTRVEDFRFLPRACEAIATLAHSAFRVVVVTNQSAVGRGLMTASTLDDIHARMVEHVRAAGGRIDAIFACPHRPEDGCACRKPRPGLLHKAASALNLDLSRSFMIGDSVTDVDAGRAGGCQPILVVPGKDRRAFAETARQPMNGCWTASDLLDAVALILAREGLHVDSAGDR